MILDQTVNWMEQNLETAATPFQGFKDYEVQRLRRDISWMRQGQSNDNTAAQADFYKFFSEHDRRRRTNFLSTFPEMKSWWAECEYHAKQT